VALFPLDRTAVMICERFFVVTESDIQTDVTRHKNHNEPEMIHPVRVDIGFIFGGSGDIYDASWPK
jgi:hypothetical protein